MNALVPQPVESPESASDTEADGTPFSRQIVTLTKEEHIELKWQASYWKNQHQRALQRIAELEQELEAERAKNRDLTQRLYGKKSEKLVLSLSK